MSVLRICGKCSLPITNDPRIARERAVCTCVLPREGIGVLLTHHTHKEKDVWTVADQCDLEDDQNYR